jgi:Ca2+-binding EF-hand superfamily protein
MWKKEATDGQITKVMFAEGMKRLCGVTDELLLDTYFSAFDRNRDGKIDLKEFLTGLSVVARGTTDERLKCMKRERE